MRVLRVKIALVISILDLGPHLFVVELELETELEEPSKLFESSQSIASP